MESAMLRLLVGWGSLGLVDKLKEVLAHDLVDQVVHFVILKLPRVVKHGETSLIWSEANSSQSKRIEEFSQGGDNFDATATIVEPCTYQTALWKENLFSSSTLCK